MNSPDSSRLLDRHWPGPRPYTEYQASEFVGRNAEIGAALDRIAGQRLTVLHAPSAAGKTSLLQAGILPELRYARLEALETAKSPSGRPFPLLLNQWLGRVGSGRTMDIARLLLVEVHRHLASSRRWYEAEARGALTEPAFVEALNGEIGRIDNALKGLAALSVLEGFVTTSDGADLRIIEGAPREEGDDREITDLLLKMDRVLGASFESVVLILDQFEEVLGDPVLGRQAIVAVEAMFKLCPESIRQMLSMRNDSAHLLEPLETRGTLDQRRVMIVYPLMPEDVARVVKEVSDKSGVTWDPEALKRLIAAFTDAPEASRGRRDVNLLGLQVALRELFDILGRGGQLRVGLREIGELCEAVAGATDLNLEEWLDRHTEEDDDGIHVVRAKLATEAPRRWIERSLDNVAGDRGEQRLLPSGIGANDFEPALIGPMVARMAAWLVTPAGFKRPMTVGELSAVAYENDLRELGANDVAGRAARLGIGFPDSRLTTLLANTLQVALHRLTEVGHVLKGRGSGREASFELVHDQFGRPLQVWARDFLRTPCANLGALYAFDDVRMKWGRRDETGVHTVLGDSLEVNGGMRALDTVKWRGCTIRGVDFSGIAIQNSDFSRTEFVDCIFDARTAFSGCVLTQALFRKCIFSGSLFKGSTLNASRWEDGTRLEGVAFRGGSAVDCVIADAEVIGCSFLGDPTGKLNMSNSRILGASLSGTTSFEFCTLDGLTISPDDGTDDSVRASLHPGNLQLSDCSLNGAEFVDLDFDDNVFAMVRCEARGALFTNVHFDDTGNGQAQFFDAVLDGAVFQRCALPRARFELQHRGPASLYTTVMKDTSLRNARFVSQDMNNFALTDCLLEEVYFDGCKMQGGTIAVGDDVATGVERVRGTLRFTDCELNALELSGLDFVDGELEILRSRAPSLLLAGVTFPRREGGRPRARFSKCKMPGVLFLGCVVQSVFMEDSEAPALIVRGDARLHTLGLCSFRGVNLENLTIESVAIDGALTFTGCKLSGGTVAGAAASSPLVVSADLQFSNSDLMALEIRQVEFRQGRLCVRDCNCDGMLMMNVMAESNGQGPAIDFRNASLKGVVVIDCDIADLAVIGENLTPAWGLTIRSGGGVMRVASGRFANLDLDGFVMGGVTAVHRVIFEKCTLFRSLFERLKSETAEGGFDVQGSDLLFAQVDDASRESAGSAHPVLRMSPGQLDGVNKAAAALKHARFRQA